MEATPSAMEISMSSRCRNLSFAVKSGGGDINKAISSAILIAIRMAGRTIKNTAESQLSMN